MKKFLLAMIISSGFALAAGAQSKFSIGPTGGYGWATINNIKNSKFKAAGNFGLASVYSAAEHFGIGIDARYSIEGAKWDVGNSKTNEIDLHYVRIPVKAIYFFNKYGNKVRPKIYAGPSFGILSSSKLNRPGLADVDLKAATESFDVGVTAGAGLNYRLVNKTWLNLDLGYYNGFKQIMQPSALGNDASTNGNLRNRNVTINVGVNFGL
jgi:outer membrane protein W